VGIRRETLLAAVTAVPPAATALLLLWGSPLALEFIERQLVATSAATALSFGVSVTLASLPLGAATVPPRWALSAPSVLFLLLAAGAALAGRHGVAVSMLMADLVFASVLYRMPGMLFTSRLLLFAQFLPLAAGAGVATLSLVCAAMHADLWRRGVYRAAPAGRTLQVRQLAGAWLASTAKDFFYRGHYVALVALGLAGAPYAMVLRFLDLVSRPTDYLFQRLVDRGRIAGRVMPVLLFAPVVAIVGALVATQVGALGQPGAAGLALVGAVSALVFVSKYLSFNENADFRHARLALVYAASLAAALPALALSGSPMYPLAYLAVSLLACAMALLWLRRDPHSKDDPPNATEDPPR